MVVVVVFLCFRKPEMAVLNGKQFVELHFLVKESFIFHDPRARLGSLCLEREFWKIVIN